MLRPANVLVLDEPTNDLDLPTLGVLEEALLGFDGAVLLVTHDRYFLDRVATQILAFHPVDAGANADDDAGQGGTEARRLMAFADLAQWEAWYAQAQAAVPAPRPVRVAPAAAAAGATPRKKLTFTERHELERIEGLISAVDARLAALEAECARPEVAVDSARLVALDADITTARAESDRLYARWAELEAKASADR
jgi:ABC transport system ATP-binding/permease protein